MIFWLSEKIFVVDFFYETYQKNDQVYEYYACIYFFSVGLLVCEQRKFNHVLKIQK